MQGSVKFFATMPMLHVNPRTPPQPPEEELPSKSLLFRSNKCEKTQLVATLFLFPYAHQSVLGDLWTDLFAKRSIFSTRNTTLPCP